MKKLWLKIKGTLIVIFGGAKKFEKFLEEHADEAIDFVESIKQFVNSSTVITLISIFPKYQAKAQHFLDEAEKFLNELLTRLNLATECMTNPVTVERIKCLVDVIRGKNDEERADIYQKMGVTYIQMKSRQYTKDGTEISKSLARSINEMKYQERIATLSGIKPANVA